MQNTWRSALTLPVAHSKSFASCHDKGKVAIILAVLMRAGKSLRCTSEIWTDDHHGAKQQSDAVHRRQYANQPCAAAS